MGQFLLVDDNLAFAENLAEVLEDVGHGAQVVGSGAEALAATHARRFDALLTDMRMPGMDGVQLVHAVHQVDPGLPALLITACPGVNGTAAAQDEEILAVLPKPVPLEALFALLSQARRDDLAASNPP